MPDQSGGDLPNKDEEIEEGDCRLILGCGGHALDGRNQRRQRRHALAQWSQQGQAFVQSLVGRGRFAAGGEKSAVLKSAPP